MPEFPEAPPSSRDYTTYRPMRARSGGAAPEWHWTDYAGILLDRFWIVVTILAVVVAIGAVRVRREVPMYRCSARILIEENMTKVLSADDLFSAGSRNIETFNTHVLALSSRSMMAAALKQGGLGDNPRFVSQSLSEADKVSAALEWVQISPVPRSRLIDIIVEHSNPQLGADLANSLAQQYIAANLSLRMDASMETFGWMKRMADDYREKIDQGQVAIHEYRKNANSVSLEDNQNIVVGKLKSVSAELTTAESQRAAVEAEWNKVQAAVTAKQPLALLTSISDDPAVLATKTDLQRKQSEVAILRTRYQEQYPGMIKARNEEQELVALYDKACLDAARRVESRYKLAVENVATLRQTLKQQEQEALELDRQLVKYNQLKHAVEADQQVYDVIVARMKETKMAGEIKASNIRLVDSAEPARTPFRPQWRRAMMASVMLGLALGVALCLASYFLDDRLRRMEDVESALDARVLTVVPPVDAIRLADRARIAERDPHIAASESFRSLRAGLVLHPDWPKFRRLLITSTTSGEGKSFVASNLAIILAQDGQRTVLIDGDMRRPTTHHMFENKATGGLAGLVGGDCKLEDAMYTTPVANLSVIGAGSMPENPSELLGSQEMRRLLETLGQRFDRIVIDCPPVFGVSDPISLLPAMDAVVFVVHYGKVGRRAAARAIGRIRESRVPILGVVFNKVALRLSSGYYYYYRYHGYEYAKARKTK